MNFSMQIITTVFTQFILLQPVTILTDKENKYKKWYNLLTVLE